MQYVIESKIPPPFPLQRGFWGNLARRMKVGDSVLVENHNKATSLRRHISLLHGGKSSVYQTQEDGSVRVWRVEPEEKTQPNGSAVPYAPRVTS